MPADPAEIAKLVEWLRDEAIAARAAEFDGDAKRYDSAADLLARHGEVVGELARKELERWNWEQSAITRARERDAAREIIVAAANELDPECPDSDAYADGHCSLAEAARGCVRKLAAATRRAEEAVAAKDRGDAEFMHLMAAHVEALKSARNEKQRADTAEKELSDLRLAYARADDCARRSQEAGMKAEARLGEARKALDEMTVERNRLREMLGAARTWGISSTGYDASIAMSLARDVDALARSGGAEAPNGLRFEWTGPDGRGFSVYGPECAEGAAVYLHWQRDGKRWSTSFDLADVVKALDDGQARSGGAEGERPAWRWEYEDRLGDMPDAVYRWLFPHSRVIDGVRMFPLPAPPRAGE